MKKTDYLLMTYLRQNARESLTKLSRMTKIPVSTIFDKIRSYERDSVLKHTTLVDFARLGFSTRAKMILKTEKKDRDQLRQHLISHMSVNSVYKINNGYDFLVDGVFRDMREVEDFLEGLEEHFSIRERKTYFVIEDIKKETFMSQPEMVDVIMGE